MLKLFLMEKISKFFLIFAVLALISVLIPQIVLADPPAPSQVSVACFCYRNLLETGDFFLLVDYDIAYSGGYPTVPASDTFTFRLFDPTGSTEIADALPYVFTTATTGFTGTNGYGMGVVAYYFNATSAPAWGDNYIIRVSGNPAELTFSGDYEISTSAYDSGSNAAIDLAAQLRSVSTSLSTQWNVPLLSDTSATSVFTADGEGISAMPFRVSKAWRRTFLRIFSRNRRILPRHPITQIYRILTSIDSIIHGSIPRWQPELICFTYRYHFLSVFSPWRDACG